MLRKIKRFQRRSEKSPRFVSVIFNPDAGQERPVLKAFNRIFKAAGCRWEIQITNEFGDGRRLAEQAVDKGADVVAVYGGDGTVMDVAAGLIHSSVPLAILPGGTANAVAFELGIPRDIVDACALIVDPDHTYRQVDVGQVNDICFLLRVGVGFEASVVEGAGREQKDRYGLFAYFLSILISLNQASVSRYELTIDGKKVEIEGLACMIANFSSIGLPGLPLSPKIEFNDGLLDVFVIRRVDLMELFALASSVFGNPEEEAGLPHWHATTVEVHSHPPQSIEADGELIGRGSARMRVLPKALKVIVPSKLPPPVERRSLLEGIPPDQE